MISQLEFPLIAVHFPPGSVKMPSRRIVTTPAPTHPDPLLLASALTAENIGFLSFAMIVALHRAKAPLPLATLASSVGHSYFAVRSQIVNTHYFSFGVRSPLVTAVLTAEAHTKLARIEKRLKITNDESNSAKSK
jgi:hypothetical protein